MPLCPEDWAPVSALRAVLENIVDGVTEPDPATLRTALQQTERLAGLVEQLLDLSRVEGGATSMRLAHVRLQEFLTVCRDEAAMSGRPVRFDVTVEPADLTVLADRERLHQVLANLVDNATRHSPEGWSYREAAFTRHFPSPAVCYNSSERGAGGGRLPVPDRRRWASIRGNESARLSCPLVES